MTAMIHALFCESTTASVDILGRLRCDGCRYIQEPKRAPVKLVSNHRCPVHQDTPVTWRGTGCSSCAALKVKSAAARRAKRKKALEPITPTERPER